MILYLKVKNDIVFMIRKAAIRPKANWLRWSNKAYISQKGITRLPLMLILSKIFYIRTIMKYIS